MQSHMQEKNMVIARMRERYRRATKKAKGEMLAHLIAAHRYKRNYAARLLRGHQEVQRSRRDDGRRRPALYRNVYALLKRIWRWYDYVCGKRLAAILPEALGKLEACGELVVDNEQRTLLRRISARTIDRLLAAGRRALQPRGRACTRPGSLLKHQIPVKTFAEWRDSEPGYTAMDCVGHDGGNAYGEFNYTLVVTDVATGWTEVRAVRNKAQTWVFAALMELREQFPCALRGIHSDNGSEFLDPATSCGVRERSSRCFERKHSFRGAHTVPPLRQRNVLHRTDESSLVVCFCASRRIQEFINGHLARWCRVERITFTRSRPHRANDNCHVEQKNWSVVRRAVGYGRHCGDEAVLNRLYDVLRLYTNYFMPVMKCIAKTRHGSRVTRHYDAATTPYARMLASAQVPEPVKARLRAIYAQLNPVALKRDITRVQGILARRAARHAAGRPEVLV